MPKQTSPMMYSSPPKIMIVHQPVSHQPAASHRPQSPLKYLPHPPNASRPVSQSRPVTSQPLPSHTYYAQNQGKMQI